MIGDDDPNRHRLLRFKREVAGLVPGSRDASGAHAGPLGLGIVYGGGSQGSMGRLAAGALGAGGKVVGVIPRFMDELEWGHRSLTELRVVDTMHERKQLMLELADAVVALPGGCGTLEELFESHYLEAPGLVFWPHRAGERERLFRFLYRVAFAMRGGAVHGRAASGHVVGGDGTRGGGRGHPRRARMERRGPRFRAGEMKVGATALLRSRLRKHPSRERKRAVGRYCRG